MPPEGIRQQFPDRGIVVAAGTGSTVRMMMWQGDRSCNTYVRQYGKPKLKELYGIELEISSGQGKI